MMVPTISAPIAAKKMLETRALGRDLKFSKRLGAAVRSPMLLKE